LTTEIVNIIKTRDFTILFGIDEGDCVFIQFFKEGVFKYMTDYKLKREYFNSKLAFKIRQRIVL
jgi:hypothetical protein